MDKSPNPAMSKFPLWVSLLGFSELTGKGSALRLTRARITVSLGRCCYERVSELAVTGGVCAEAGDQLSTMLERAYRPWVRGMIR